MSTTRIRAAAILASGALISGLAVGLTAPTAHAAFEPCDAPANSALAPGEADFDGDGQGDVAYGVPAWNDSTGRVVVEQSTRGVASLTSASTGDSAGAGAQFGVVVRAIEIDNDGCTDLVISAPAAHDSSGRVYVVFGATTGIGSGRPAVIITAPKPAAGERFGEALDVSDLWSGDDITAYLAVGAPGTDVAGARDAGAVHFFGVNNEDQFQVDRLWSWTQGAKGVGEAEKGDRFGEVVLLRPGRSGLDITVGVPHEDVGKKVNAGAVNIRTMTGGITTITQNTKGVPDKAERGDQFGAALAGSGRTLAVGVPGENLGKKLDAGQIQLFTQKVTSWGGRINGSYVPGKALTLDTRYVSGKPRKADRLGSSLAILRGLQHARTTTVAAGMSSRHVGAATFAGAVALFELKANCPKKASVCGRVITQATKGVAGSPESSANFGASLSINAELGPETDNERRDALLVGAPGSSGTAGTFVQWRPSASSVVVDPAGAITGERFGSTVPARWTAPSLYR